MQDRIYWQAYQHLIILVQRGIFQIQSREGLTNILNQQNRKWCSNEMALIKVYRRAIYQRYYINGINMMYNEGENSIESLNQEYFFFPEIFSYYIKWQFCFRSFAKRDLLFSFFFRSKISTQNLSKALLLNSFFLIRKFQSLYHRYSQINLDIHTIKTRY